MARRIIYRLNRFVGEFARHRQHRHSRVALRFEGFVEGGRVLAEQLRPRQSRHLLEGRIDEGDTTGRVETHETIRRQRKDRVKARGGLADLRRRPQAIGDIRLNAHHVRDFARRVAHQRNGELVPEQGSVLAVVAQDNRR